MQLLTLCKRINAVTVSVNGTKISQGCTDLQNHLQLIFTLSWFVSSRDNFIIIFNRLWFMCVAVFMNCSSRCIESEWMNEMQHVFVCRRVCVWGLGRGVWILSTCSWETLEEFDSNLSSASVWLIMLRMHTHTALNTSMNESESVLNPAPATRPHYTLYLGTLFIPDGITDVLTLLWGSLN